MRLILPPDGGMCLRQPSIPVVAAASLFVSLPAVPFPGAEAAAVERPLEKIIVVATPA